MHLNFRLVVPPGVKMHFLFAASARVASHQDSFAGRGASVETSARKTDAAHLCGVTAAAALDTAAEMSGVLKFCWLEACYTSMGMSSGAAA